MSQQSPPPLQAPPVHELQKPLKRDARQAAAKKAAGSGYAGEVAGPMPAPESMPLQTSTSWQPSPSSDWRPQNPNWRRNLGTAEFQQEASSQPWSARRRGTASTSASTAHFGPLSPQSSLEGYTSPNGDPLGGESQGQSSGSSSPVSLRHAGFATGAGGQQPLETLDNASRAPVSPQRSLGCAAGLDAAECMEDVDGEESTGDFSDFLDAFDDGHSTSGNTTGHLVVSDIGGSIDESTEGMQAPADNRVVVAHVSAAEGGACEAEPARISEGTAEHPATPSAAAEFTTPLPDRESLADAKAAKPLPMESQVAGADVRELPTSTADEASAHAILQGSLNRQGDGSELRCLRGVAAEEVPTGALEGGTGPEDATAGAVEGGTSSEVDREDGVVHAGEVVSLHESSRKHSIAHPTLDAEQDASPESETTPEAKQFRGYPVRVALSGGESMQAHLWTTEENVLKLNPVRKSALTDIQTRLDQIAKEQATLAEQVQEVQRQHPATERCRELQQQVDMQCADIAELQSSMQHCRSAAPLFTADKLKEELHKKIDDLQTNLEAAQEAHASLCLEVSEYGSSADEMKTAWEETRKSLIQALDDGLSNLAAEHAKRLEELDARTCSAAKEAGKVKATAEVSKVELLATAEKLTEGIKEHAKEDLNSLQATVQKLTEDMEVTEQHVEGNCEAISVLKSSLENLQQSNALLELAEKAHSKDISDLKASVGGPFAGYVQKQLEPHLASLAALEESVKDLQASQGHLQEASSGEQKCRIPKSEFGVEWQQQLRKLEQETHRRLCDATSAQAASLMETCREFEEEWRQEWQQQYQDFEKEAGRQLREATDAQSISLAETRKEIEMAMEGQISQILSTLMPERKTGAAKKQEKAPMTMLKVSDEEQSCRSPQRCDEEWREQLQELDNKTERRLHEVTDAQSALLAETRKEIETAMEGHISQVISLLMAEKAASSARCLEEGDICKKIDDLQSTVEAAQEAHSSLRMELEAKTCSAAEVAAKATVIAEASKAELLETVGKLTEDIKEHAQQDIADLQGNIEKLMHETRDHAKYESSRAQEKRLADRGFQVEVSAEIQRLASLIEAQAVEIQRLRVQEDPAAAFQLEVDRAFFESELQDGQRRVDDALHRLESEMCGALNLTERAATEHLDRSEVQEALHECSRKSAITNEVLHDSIGTHEREISELHRLVALLRETEEGMSCKLSTCSASQEALQEELRAYQSSVALLQETEEGISCKLSTCSASQNALQEELRVHQTSTVEVLASHNAQHKAVLVKLHGHETSTAEILASHSAQHQAVVEKLHCHETSMAEILASQSAKQEALQDKLHEHQSSMAEALASHTAHEQALREKMCGNRESTAEILAPTQELEPSGRLDESHATLMFSLESEHSQLDEKAAVRAELERALEPASEQVVPDGVPAHVAARAPQREARLVARRELEETSAAPTGTGTPKKSLLRQSARQRQGSKDSAELHQSMSSGEHYSDDSFEDEGDSQRRSGFLCASSSAPARRRSAKSGSEEDAVWAAEAQHLRTQHEQLRQQVVQTSDEQREEISELRLHFKEELHQHALQTSDAQREEISELRAHFDATLHCLQEPANSTAHFGRDDTFAAFDDGQPASLSQQLRATGMTGNSSLEEAGLSHAVGLQVKAELQEALEVQKAIFQKVNRRMGKALGEQFDDVFKDTGRGSSSASSGDCATVVTAAAEQAAALQAANDAANCRELVSEMRSALLQQHAESAEVCRYAEDAMAAARAEAAAMVASRIVAPVSADSSNAWEGVANIRTTPAVPSRAWVAPEDVSLGADLADEVRSCFSDGSQQSHAQHRLRAAQMARQPSPMAPGLSVSQTISSCGGKSSSSGAQVAVPSLQTLGPRGSGAGLAPQFPNRPRSLAASQSEPSLAMGSSAVVTNGTSPVACRSSEAAAAAHSGHGQAGEASTSRHSENSNAGARGRQHQAAWVPACAPRALSSSALRHSGARRRLGRALAQAVEIQERRSIATSGHEG